MTFPTGVVKIRKCSDEELKTMLDEAKEASKHSRKLGRVMEIVSSPSPENERPPSTREASDLEEDQRF